MTNEPDEQISEAWLMKTVEQYAYRVKTSGWSAAEPFYMHVVEALKEYRVAVLAQGRLSTPPQPEPVVDASPYLRSVVEQIHRDTHDALEAVPVEASRTPVETARCGAISRSGTVLVRCELADGHRGPGHRSGNGWWGDESPAHKGYLLEPVPPSPEAVEPPLTDRQKALEGEGLIDYLRRQIEPVESSQEGSETPYLGHSFIRAANGGPICCACAKPEAEHGPYQQQEGSETGGVREAWAQYASIIGLARLNKANDRISATDYLHEQDRAERIVEQAIARDAEERARAAAEASHEESLRYLAEDFEHLKDIRDSAIEDKRRERERAEAAEERATQAEGQREALERAVTNAKLEFDAVWRAVQVGSGRDDADAANEAGRIAENASRMMARALSPSTEAPSEDYRW